MINDISQHHATVAQAFEEAAELYKDTHGDVSWSLVILHYAALHWINVVLVKCGFKPNDKKTNHKLRETIVDRCHTGLEEISRHYRMLKTVSTQVRYRGDQMTKGDYKVAFTRFYSVIKAKAQELAADADFPTDEQTEKVKEILAENGFE